MTTINSWMIILSIALCGCQQTQPKKISPSTQADFKDSITEREIYDFMQVVITDQKLRKENGIATEPESRCDFSIDDKDFLKTLLIDTTKEKEISDSLNPDQMTFTTSFGQLDKCLTNADIDFMLQQKNGHLSFKWDNNRLDFDTENKKYWYAFSIPLFSKDKTKAIIMIEDLCPGLCGGGWTVLFKRQNGKWTSQKGNQWLH